MELGHVDVDLASSGQEVKNVDTGEYIALEDGRTLTVKVRIEQGAALSDRQLEYTLSFAPRLHIPPARFAVRRQ